MSSMHAFAPNSSSESSGDEDDFLHPNTDPRADEFVDYNPRKRRRTGRDAKESAALGVFGSESENDDGPGQRWKKKNLRSKGMAFVSTGQRNVDDEDEEGAEVEDEEEEEDEAMDDVREVEETAGLRGGLGFSAGKGLGFQSPALKKKNGPVEHSTPLGRGFVPSSAAAPILRNTDDEEASMPRTAFPSAFSTPASTNGKGRGGKTAQSGAPVNAGSFAARMMAKMGYKEGQGLGKEGTGRSGIIEVQLRPQGIGLGAVKEKSKQEKEEEKRQAKIRGEVYEDSDEERKKRQRKPKGLGSASGTDSGMSTPRRATKTKYKTVAEIQRAAPGLDIPDAFAPILDLTAPGQRLLTSTSGLLTPTAASNESQSAEKVESMKLARRAQNDLSAFVEEWKNLEERKAFVEMSIVEQTQQVEVLENDFDQMQLFATTVQVSQAVRDMQWDPVIEALTAAEKISGVSVSDELSDIAVAAVHPFLRQATEGWQPLEDPKLNGMASAIFNIRHIIGATSNEKSLVNSNLKNGLSNGSRRHGKSTTAYESMIYKIIFPKVVSAINQGWDVHNPTPLQALLDAWDGLLPSFVRAQILDQAVVGKLNEAVSSWNPRKRRHHDLPHLWLFPWLQYLPTHHADPKSSTGLVSDVKRKFRTLIDSWDFHKGVIPGLQQWREVLCPNPSNDHWTPLIMNHVLPSMARFLKNEKNFMVDPNDQAPYMSALQGIFAWQDILKPRIVGQVVVETVFPMWQNVLHQWLTVVGPNEEIGQWFEWWRDEVFPVEIKDLKSIQQEFDKGHDMINQALDLGSKVATHLPAPSQTTRNSPPAPSPPTPARPAPPIVEESTFRHRIEDWCIENDLQFLPEKKVLHSAGPLYRITAAGNGKNGTLVYFKGDSLFAVTKKGAEQVEILIHWESTDARDALLEMAWHNVK